jgi:hypothetical protein
MANPRLTAFVEAALNAGASRADIERSLVDAGWSRDQIRDGMADFADVDFRVPVPRPRAEVSARDTFLYLLMFSTLYVSAYQFGSLCFQLVNLALPDPADQPFLADMARRRLRWAVASLIVAVPVFGFVARFISREITAEPARRNSAIRKWLTYLTLLVAALVIVGDGITLIYNLLSGEMTLRFVIKALIVAAIAGALFGYFLWSARADNEALK